MLASSEKDKKKTHKRRDEELDEEDELTSEASTPIFNGSCSTKTEILMIRERHGEEDLVVHRELQAQLLHDVEEESAALNRDSSSILFLSSVFSLSSDIVDDLQSTFGNFAEVNPPTASAQSHTSSSLMLEITNLLKKTKSGGEEVAAKYKTCLPRRMSKLTVSYKARSKMATTKLRMKA
ncbi:unnamed protein product [Cochlearia groenlandica]